MTGPLMCFPLKIDAENASVLTYASEAYPSPEIGGRAAEDAPAVVRNLAAAGSALGWRVRIQWARGSLPHATTGRPGRSEESWAVRFARQDPDGGRWGAWALRRSDTWPFVWMWGTELLPFGLGGLTDLKIFLAAPGELDVAGIRERTALAEERKKEAARNRPRKAREGAT